MHIYNLGNIQITVNFIIQINLANQNLYQIIIIFMKDRKEEVSILAEALNNTFKRTLAYSFRKIYLDPDSSLNQTYRVRHYDIECESAQLIFHLLRSKMETRKMEAFCKIKNLPRRKYKRGSLSTTGKQHMSTKKRRESKETGVNTSIVYVRANSFNKRIETPSKKLQFDELFSKVKFIANDLTVPLDQSTRCYQNSTKKMSTQKSAILNQISELEANMRQLIIRSSKLSENQSTASTLKKVRDKQRVKNVRIQKLDIYI